MQLLQQLWVIIQWSLSAQGLQVTTPVTPCPICTQLSSWIPDKPAGPYSSATSTSLFPTVLAPATSNLMSSPILKHSCVVGTALWEIDLIVREAQRVQLDPGTGPVNCPNQTPIFSSLAVRLFSNLAALWWRWLRCSLSLEWPLSWI